MENLYCYITLAFLGKRLRYRLYYSHGDIRPLMNGKFLRELETKLPGATKPEQLFKFNDIFINIGQIDSIERRGFHNKLHSICAANGYPRLENDD